MYLKRKRILIRGIWSKLIQRMVTDFLVYISIFRLLASTRPVEMSNNTFRIYSQYQQCSITTSKVKSYDFLTPFLSHVTFTPFLFLCLFILFSSHLSLLISFSLSNAFLSLFPLQHFHTLYRCESIIFYDFKWSLKREIVEWQPETGPKL